MERILYLDCFAGISGDMSIAALIDLGLDSDAVISEIRKLGLSGYKIEVKKINRFSISGTDVKVTLNDSFECQHQHEHEHEHEHGHLHTHGDRERSLADVSHIIKASGISEKAKRISLEIFTEIAKAEAAVHGKKIEEVHFHEVGAVDSIVDIVGVSVCIDMLNIDHIYCSPVHEGQGFVNCQHGRLPVPVPAVIKMLGGSGISIITEDIEAELVTPTGFGIVKTLSEDCGKMPKLLVEGVGYGFGKTETGRLNALRVILGNREASEQVQTVQQFTLNETEIKQDEVSLLETNIDDTTGETLGYTMGRLMEAGALDVFFTPIFMKKNRPATILSVICSSGDIEKLSFLILKETSTIGIRVSNIKRITLSREIRTVQTELGAVRVKSVVVAGLERIQPEYEDCAKIAKEKNLSLNEVYEIVKRS